MYKEIDLNGRIIKYRKWKVKDKKALDKATTIIDKRNVFVYGCLEDPNTPLDLEEYNYLLALIRDYSLHNTLDYDLECPECHHKFSIGFTSAQIVEPIFAEYSPIEVKNHVIVVGNVKSKEVYESAINDTLTATERYITDFALHIKSINGSDIASLDEAINYISELDVDDYETIFTQWDSMRFKCNVIHGVECPNCKRKNDFDFSDMPSFFPESWEIK